MFRKNEGSLDRAIRIVAGMVFISAGLFLLEGIQGSAVGLVLSALGLWFVVTGAVGVCPMYTPFGITTLRREERPVASTTPFEAPAVPRGRDHVRV